MARISWRADGEGGPRERPPWWPQSRAVSAAARAIGRRMRGRFMRRFAVTFALGFFLFFALRGRGVRHDRSSTCFAPPRPAAGSPRSSRLAIARPRSSSRLRSRVAFRRLVGPARRPDRRGREASRRATTRVRVRARGPRELRSLATRVQLDVRASREQREAAASSLLADVTHELRTPLTVVQGNLEALLDGVYPADARASRADPRRDARALAPGG